MIINKLGFDVVHGCGLRCIGCPNSTIHPKIEMISIDNFEKCLKNINVSFVNIFRFFNFGDPLLHPRLLDLIHILSTQKFINKESTIEISTNAQYLNEDIISGIFDKNIVTRMVVSCDGDGTPESYERLRPPAKWDRLMKFIAIVAKHKEKHGSRIKLLARIVCENNESRSTWDGMLSPFGWVIDSIGTWSHMPKVNNLLCKTKLIVPNGACRYMGCNNLYVDYDGSVVPCCKHPRAFLLGNIMNSKYTEIIENKKTMSKMMKYERKSMDICSDCNE